MDETEDRTTDRIESPPARRRGRRLVAVATGTTLALGAGGVAYAASTDPTPTPSTSAPSDGVPGEDVPGVDRPPHGPEGSGGFGGFGVLHGEAVVETADGSYGTVATQRGTVDSISDESITVTSEDGYTETYVLDPAALENDDRGPAVDVAELAAGDEVVVMATVDGSTSTVERLIDLANLPAWLGPGGPHGHHLPDSAGDVAPETAAS